MTDLYLIAHKVRGEPAFDIAERMVCSLCAAEGCAECDDNGYWWIIPTSGHRAYPYAYQPWHAMDIGPGFDGPMPSDLPDHYPLRHAPSSPRVDILSLLPSAPQGPTIRRRL